MTLAYSTVILSKLGGQPKTTYNVNETVSMTISHWACVYEVQEFKTVKRVAEKVLSLEF